MIKKISSANAVNNILVVDDSSKDRRLLKALLEKSHYQVHCLKDGELVLEYLASQSIDLILMDIKMPGLDGIATCRKLKSHPQYKQIPILFLSALVTTQEKLQAFQAGGVDYITKPFSIDEVLVRVATHLELFALRDELEAQVQEKHFRSIVDNVPQGMVIIDKKMKVQAYNSLAYEIFGMPSSCYYIGQDFAEILKQWTTQTEQDEMMLQVAVDDLQRREFFDFEFPQMVHGEERWCYMTHTPLPDGGIVRTFMDITERKHSEENLMLMQFAFDHISEAAYLITEQAQLQYVNDGTVRQLGYDKWEMSEMTMLDIDPDYSQKKWRNKWRTIKKHGSTIFQTRHRRKDGSMFPVEISASYIEYRKRGLVLAFAHDITQQKQQQDKLKNIAYYDPLTQLPNRVLLSDRMHLAIAHAKRHEKSIAIAYLDLDGFKEVNDNFGHDIGDQLLKTIADRCRNILRGEETIARLGGDEFLAILINLNQKEDVLPSLTRLIEAIAEPMQLESHHVNVSASIGITYYPQEEEIDADQLIRQADQAMYQAKLAGKNRYSIFNTEQDRQVRTQHDLLRNIEAALSNDEFTLYYQPKVNIRSGTVVGVEALIRWQHPQRGLLFPADFLNAITENPLSIKLDEWVLNHALKQQTIWHQEDFPMSVSVNIGSFTLQQSNFVQKIQHILSKYPPLKANSLTIEILETSILEDLEHVSQVIKSCAKMGIDFALDDFGTGYSSLAYLKHLPVSQLKMDKSYVFDILNDPEDLAILDGVINFAQAFNSDSIAEGVETLAHGAMLLKLGCELAQGYVIAKPMPADQIKHWVEHWQQPDEWKHIQTVSRDNRTALYAGVEHNAWLHSILQYLDNQNPQPPLMDSQACRFGIWLNSTGRRMYHNSMAFKSIVKEHEELHKLANQAIQFKHSYQYKNLKTHTDKLRQKSQHLLKMLELLT